VAKIDTKPTSSATATGPLCQNLAAPAHGARGTRPRILMSSELIKHTSDASFNADVIESDKPVLVDYWAEWCGPCKMIAPILDEVSKDYDGRLKIAKMNVDENRDVPAKYGIRAIPTMKVFKGGQVVKEIVGAKPKNALLADLA
jgi:thioredoxin 1